MTSETATGGLVGLSPLYAPIIEAAGIFVIGQLGQSLDGRIATPSGHSRTIGGPDSITHLHRLRSLCDAVIVGIGTVLADDPQLTVRHCAGRHPARVVIDPNGRLPPDARFLGDDRVSCFAVQAHAFSRPARVVPLVLASREGRIDPHALIAELASRGMRRLLVEGGAHTVSAFLAAGALHRLHVCVAPVVIGSGPTGLCLPQINRMEQAIRPHCTTYQLGSDILFDLALD